MAFGWLIRHQKKVLFILAAFLVVGWVLGGAISSLLRVRQQVRGSDVDGRIAGEDVTFREFISFKRAWSRVFPDTLGRYAMETRWTGQNVTIDEVAWAYLGLLKLAQQNHMRVSDRRVLDLKRYIYQRSTEQGAQLDDDVRIR